MSIRHPIGRQDVNLVQLRRELADRLGFPVETVAQLATDDDPGVLICEHPETGEWLDVEDGVIADVIAAHIPPPSPTTREERALAAFDAAPTVAARLGIFRDYLAGRVAEQSQQRDAATALRRARAPRER